MLNNLHMLHWKQVWWCIYLFIYGLFNDALNSSDYIFSNDRTTNEYWIEKDKGASGSGLI
jgi:hypothetical protein